MPNATTLEQIVSLSKRRGFVYPTSEIYGGLANSYDYGPLGAQLLKNIRDLWWKRFIEDRPDMVGLDSAIIQHPQTWVASGHVDAFTDPLVEDKVTHKRYRADHLVEQWLEKNPDQEALLVEDMSTLDLGELISKHKILSPDGNAVTSPKDFNILFETAIGSVSGEKSKAYLRGETAQGIFTNFKQILDSSRVRLPFGVGQIGKSFRNEITTGQFVFRTLEFEQAEIEYFFNPLSQDWSKLLDAWKDSMWNFVTIDLGVSPKNLRWRRHTDKERSHYSRDTYDLDYRFPFGWKELWGVAYRTDYDLKQHAKFSGQALEYRDPNTSEVFVPHVIEPALGLSRAFLMLLTEGYFEDEDNQRTALKLKPSLAPYAAAVFPLLKNKPELIATARSIYEMLRLEFRVAWDDRGNIGKRYLYQDEIGTPFCITVDFESLDDNALTVRSRDTGKQVRVARKDLINYLRVELRK
jgi:glycyl-tRNA synthetase